MISPPVRDPAAPPSPVKQRDAEPLPGYRLLEPLGRGSLGEVWKAEAPGGQPKAIKFVPTRLLARPGDGDGAPALDVLQRVKALRHPGLLFLDRVKVVGEDLVLVTELAETNLRDVLVRWQKAGLPGVPRELLLAYLREAAETLDVLNGQHDLPHLDLKPANLLVAGDRVKVGDAGLALLLPGQRAAAYLSPYAAPELRLGIRSRFSDQYSLASIFRELLTGRPGGGADLADADREVLARALAEHPEARFPSCAELIRALASAGAVAGSANGDPALPRGNGSPTTCLGGAGEATGEAPAPGLRPGSCAALPGYRFQSCLGRDPGGETWLVVLPDGRTRLARLVLGFGGLDPDQEQEAVRRLGALSDPALPRLEAVHSDPGRVVVVSELPGKSLRERLEECRRQRLEGVPRPDLLAYLRGLAEALDRLHQEHGLQHLALSPDHVVLERGRLLIRDFGLAQLFWLPGGLPASTFGPRYAAPELFDGEVSRSCDQYSLALIYQELLTGLHPFRHLARPRRAADRPRRRPDLGFLPSADRAVVLRALDPDPARRFASCTELVRALEGATPRKDREPEQVLTALPKIITWPGARVGPAATAPAGLPPLDQLLPQLIAAAAGPVQVREYQSIRFLLHPGESLQHRCAAWLPPGVAEIKLTGFARQWRAEVIDCDEHSFVGYVPVPASFWQRCLGREVGLEVAVRLRQPPAPLAKLTQVDVVMRPQAVNKGQRAQLLWEVGPRLLESLRTHLQARPEQRHEPRLLCQHTLRVSPVSPGLQLAAPLEVHSKDISPTGIGFFLPDQPASPQVYLNLGGESFTAALGVLARIVRVQPCGDGWYEVGATFPLDDPHAPGRPAVSGS